MEQFGLQLAIAFFAVQVAAWTGLGVYLRVTHQRRAQNTLTRLLVETQSDAALAQAA